MARPLSGRVTLRGSRFQASVPTERGSTRRHYEVFDTKAQADAWCALAVANLSAGIPLPSRDAVLGETDPSRRARQPSARVRGSSPAVRRTVAQVADAWFHEVYIDGRSGGADRANSVRATLNRRVLPFLQPIFDRGRALTREEYRHYLGELGRPSPIHDGRRCGPKTFEGLSQDTLADVRRCLDAVIKLGMATAGWDVPFDLADVRTPRSRRTSQERAASLSLGEVARIAAHMHAVHQLVLWTCRVLTLRLGEAYGIRVEDLVPLGDGSGRGLLWLHAQGGRKFHTFEGEHMIGGFHKEGMKHGYSERMQLVPAQLMALYECAIDAFHTDPETGAVGQQARMIPALVVDEAGGQETFRIALKRAAEAAGVTTVALNGFRRTALRLPTPKDLRSSAVTDLEWVPGLDPTALRRYAGHAPGTDVHALHYVTDQPINDKMLQVCQAMEDLIDRDLPDGLLIPTRIRCTTGSQSLLAQRGPLIDQRLAEQGWLVTDTDRPEDPWLNIEEVADLLGRAPTTVRRWVKEGRIPARLAQPVGGTHEGHRVRVSVAVEFAKAEMRRRTIGDAEEALGISYHRLYGWITRFGLAVERTGQRNLYIPERTFSELDRLAALERRLQKEGVPFAEAARLLGVQSRTIHARVQLGTLKELPERGPDGTRYVARDSVRRVLRNPRLMSTRPTRRRARRVD